MTDGNPFYNPNVQGPDWGSGIMAVYANLERLKQQKLAEQMMQQKFGLEQQKAASEAALNEAQVRESGRRGEYYGAQADVLREKPIPETYDVGPGALKVAAQYFGYDPAEIGQWSGKAKQDLITGYQNAKREEMVAKLKPPTGTSEGKPDAYDKRVANAQRLFKEGKITQADLNRILTGAQIDVSDTEKMRSRNTLDYQTRKAWSVGLAQLKAGATDEETLRQSGFNPDMPEDYQLAAKRIEAGLHDDADIDTVNKGEALWKYFKNNLFGKMTYEDFVRSQPSIVKKLGPNVNLIKKWFDKYQKRRGFLKPDLTVEDLP
jgi:hypothetical protein